MEEAKARVDPGDLFAVLSVPHIDQVHTFHRARLLDFAAGAETLEPDLRPSLELTRTPGSA
jgi:hypothetical protein